MTSRMAVERANPVRVAPSDDDVVAVIRTTTDSFAPQRGPHRFVESLPPLTWTKSNGVGGPVVDRRKDLAMWWNDFIRSMENAINILDDFLEKKHKKIE